MHIKVMGGACARCRKLYADTEQALTRLGLSATLTKVEDAQELLAYGVSATPALIIDDQLKCFGRLPKAGELEAWLTGAQGRPGTAPTSGE